MKKTVMIAVMLLLGFSGCGKDTPVIRMGTGLDEKNHRVTGEKTVFATNDTIAFSFSKKSSFDTPVINARIYRGDTVFDMVRIFNEDIPLGPDTRRVEKSLPAWNLAAKHGAGNYLLLFMIGEKVVARQKFSIEAPKYQVIPVDQVGTDANAPVGNLEEAADAKAPPAP